MAGIIYCLTYVGARVAYFRRQYTQLEGIGGAIVRSHELLTGIAKYNQQKRQWKFPNGSVLKFAYLDNDDAVHNYQSTQMDVILFDEASQFTWYQLTYMQSRIRSVKGYPTFSAYASNPGGVSAGQIKQFFIRAGEPEMPHVVEVEPGKKQVHMFIPAKLADNLILEKNDPQYRKNLENLPEILRRQLLEGDWDTAEGMAWTEWREAKHVIPPFVIPDDWIRFRSYDHGYVKPYAVGWYAVDHDGRLYLYRELYGYGGRADVGSKEDPEDIAAKIIKLEAGEKISYAVADSAIFGGRQDSSLTIAEQFADAFGSRGVHWQPVSKGPGSRVAGKLEIHHRLKWEEGGDDPMFLVFNTCRHFIRTFPNMILDDKNPEDIDTTLEDHHTDQFRYACISRPMVPQKPKEKLTDIQKHKKRLADRNKQNGYHRIV